jgi:acyl-coenzyme A thioesterase PaaI-like protein
LRQQVNQTIYAPPPKPRGRLFRRLLGSSALLAFGYFVGVASSNFMPIGMLMAANNRNLSKYQSPDEVEAQLWSNPLVQQLSNDPNFVMTRPNQTLPENFRKGSLTGGTLLGSGKFEIPALVFTKPDGSECVAVHYLGGEMCGWPGFVHGGLLATILDEGLARTCFEVLPNKVGMTAKLTVNYRFPCKANQFVVLRAKTTGAEGRKAWVEGQLYELTYSGENGKLICEGDALFVEPKGATKLLGGASRALNKMNEVVKR